MGSINAAHYSGEPQTAVIVLSTLAAAPSVRRADRSSPAPCAMGLVTASLEASSFGDHPAWADLCLVGSASSYSLACQWPLAESVTERYALNGALDTESCDVKPAISRVEKAKVRSYIRCQPPRRRSALWHYHAAGPPVIRNGGTDARDSRLLGCRERVWRSRGLKAAEHSSGTVRSGSHTTSAFFATLIDRPNYRCP